jgi:hypothetical protein
MNLLELRKVAEIRHLFLDKSGPCKHLVALAPASPYPKC